MPISGNEELGANTVASRDFSTGVPIKKRKFLFVRPPSPPPQVPSTIEESVSQQKEQSNSKAESSSPPEGSPSKVFRSGNVIPSSSQEENKEHSADRKVNPVQSDIVTTGFNFEEAATDIVQSSRSEMCIRSTLVVPNDIVAHKFDKSTELQLAPNNALVQKVESEMRNVSEPLKNNKPNILKELVGETLLAKNSSVPDLAVQGSERVCEEENLNPCSWNLVTTERQSSSGGNTAHLQANRTHWDLNTMMDTWQGSTNQSAVPRGVGVEEKCDMEHIMHSNKTLFTDSVGSLTDSGKKKLGQSMDKSKLSSLLSHPDQPNTNEALLSLTLSTSSGIKLVISPEPSHASPKVDSRSALSKTLNPSKNSLSPASNLKLARRVVKPEPSDDSSLKECPLKLVQCSIVKTEPCVGYLQEHHETSDIEILKLINQPVKSEPVCEVNQATPMMTEENLRKSEIYSCYAPLPLSCQLLDVPITLHHASCPTSLRLSSCAEETIQSDSLSSATGMPSSMEETLKTAQTDGAGTSASVSNDVRKAVVSDDISDIARTSVNAVDHVPSAKKATNKLKSESQVTSDVAESDEEKINIFDDMQDDCSSDTDDESDGNHVGVVDSENKPHGGEDDDYEDGEVREPLHLAIEVTAGLDKEREHACHEISDSRLFSVSCFPSEEKAVNSAHVVDRDILIEDPVVTKGYLNIGILDDVQLNNRHEICIGDPTHLQEASFIEMPATGIIQPINASERGLSDCMRREDELKGCENDLFHDGSVSSSQGISPGNQGKILGQQENVEGTNPDKTKFSVWCKTESLVNGAEATKGVNNKGNQSRIINLARAFSGPSPGKMNPFPGRFLPSRVEREKFNDGMRNGDKLYPRGRRDDGSIDGRNKFERQRYQDQPVGSTGQEFMHGRGRPDKRFDSTHGDWGSDQNFTPINFNCLTTYRFSGPKNAAAVMVARDGTVLGAGRKLMTDELPSFRHPPSRRRSPGSRGRPVAHGVQIVRRSAREISPDGCLSRTDPNLLGFRPEKKFMRGLPDDMMDSVFSRPQPQYQQADDPFIRRERRFSPIPRKVHLHNPRIRSRSPTRTRSPGSWSSPRRSPDGFGRPDMIHRRSPPYYRMKWMRSPHQRPCYAEDIDGRRHGSPPYSRLSNEMREMGASGESDHPRSFILNRSPSGRILPRGTSRFEMMDPRERVENDEYLTGPMHSDRFREIGGDGGAEGRRICAERCRSFRPHYDSGEVDKFYFHVEGGSRPYRFSPEVDAEFHERNNLREREFERRVKNRSGNAPRRVRSVEEHEENYRHTEQGWHDSAFEDVSPTKSRRF